MCGIFGYTNTEEVPALLENMGQCLWHRGPDDVGYYTSSSNGVRLGLRRLSIIDLREDTNPYRMRMRRFGSSVMERYIIM